MLRSIKRQRPIAFILFLLVLSLLYTQPVPALSQSSPAEDAVGADSVLPPDLDHNQGGPLASEHLNPPQSGLAQSLYTVSGYVKSRYWPYFGLSGISVQLDSQTPILTNSNGYFSIPNVASGTHTLKAWDASNDFWAYSTQSIQTKTITVSGNYSTNFTDFTVKGRASVTISADKTVVSPGETFNVTVNLKNTNYALSAVKAWLDLSFEPSFENSQLVIGTPTGSGWTGGLYAFPPGSTIYGVDASGNPRTITSSTKYLISGERQGNFYYNTTYSFTVPVQVKSTAPSNTAITLKYRGTIEDNRDPVSTGSAGSFPLDQQGWNARTLVVSVVPRYNISGKVYSRLWPNLGLQGIRVSTDTGQSAITDQDGNYTISSVQSGSRTLTATDPDNNYYATSGGSMSASQTINLTQNATNVNFSQFWTRGEAEVSISPNEEILVAPGQSFDVTVTLRNRGASINSSTNFTSWLDLSFDYSKFSSVTIPSSSCWSQTPQHFPPNSAGVFAINLATKQLYEMSSHPDYLISAGRTGSFSTSLTCTFTARFNVKGTASSGVVALKYRGTIGDDRDPYSGGQSPLDQQNFTVKTLNVNVVTDPIQHLYGNLVSTESVSLFGQQYTVIGLRKSGADPDSTVYLPFIGNTTNPVLANLVPNSDLALLVLRASAFQKVYGSAASVPHLRI